MNCKKLIIVLAAASLGIAGGCSEKAQPASDAASARPAAVPHKAGAQLWAENCSRCHNIRPPESFSDAQWAAVVHHMRLRADLTGEEQRTITEFLQASH